MLARYDACTILDMYAENIIARYASKNLNRQSAQAPETAQVTNNRSKRKQRGVDYRNTQYDYFKDKKQLANRILDGLPRFNSNERPNDGDIASSYNVIFGSNSVEDNHRLTDKRANVTSCYNPILSEEVVKARKDLKSSAPGPDGITKKDMGKIPIAKLELLYNFMVFLQYTPIPLRKSRTILIPKGTENLSSVDNWRPITISSLLLRTFSRLYNTRLNVIKLNAQQRGFTNMDGCFANTLILQTAIKTSRKKGIPLHVISLDLKKAFDSVSHNSIRRALSRLNFYDRTINVILSGYEGASTSINCQSHNICSVEVNRGVKQGDPLSPFLFNAIIDELVVALNSTFQGYRMHDQNITCMAYADDLIVIGSSLYDTRKSLQMCEQFFAERGLDLNPRKCSTLSMMTVPRKKKVCVATQPQFRLLDASIKTITTDETVLRRKI